MEEEKQRKLDILKELTAKNKDEDTKEKKKETKEKNIDLKKKLKEETDARKLKFQ